MSGQKNRQRRITCKVLVLAHDLPCILHHSHAMGFMEFYEGGEGIEGLQCGLHSSYRVSRVTLFGTSGSTYRPYQKDFGDYFVLALAIEY